MTSTQRTLTGFLCLVVAAGFLAPPTLGQEVVDTVGVDILARVQDSETGAPVRYALVQILGLNRHSVSDEEGIARLSNLPPGDYQIMVTKLGYETTMGGLLVEREGFFRVGLVPTDDEVTGRPGWVQGRISDRDTGGPISGVEVTLPGLQRMQITGARGSFRFDEVPPGLHVLTAEHLGYAAREDTIYLPPRQSLQVDLEMGMEPIPLEGITVSVRSRMLEVAGFYQRMNSGLSGRRWTRADIEEFDPMFLRDLIERVPGVTVRTVNLRTAAISMRRGNPCPLAVYVDGFEMPDFNFDLIRPEHVEALEVYQGIANVPIEYSLRHPCGVMLIWLRQGG